MVKSKHAVMSDFLITCFSVVCIVFSTMKKILCRSGLKNIYTLKGIVEKGGL